MYIRTRDEALDALAEILDQPDRPGQIVLTTVRIMDCLEIEPRRFMADCQALLVEGGLEALRLKRIEAQEYMPLVVLDVGGDRRCEAVASALDALRLSNVALQVFPDLVPAEDGWKVARALLRDEKSLRARIVEAIRSHGDAAEMKKARLGLEVMIRLHEPEWVARAGFLRTGCRDILEAAGVSDGEGEIVFGILATSDLWAEQVLRLMEADPPGAILEVLGVHDLLEAVRHAQDAADLQLLREVA
jgi:hypothetical protein